MKKMNCFVCSLNLLDLKNYISHLRAFHSSETNFICYNCNPERTFVSSNSFKKHISRHFNEHTTNNASHTGTISTNDLQNTLQSTYNSEISTNSTARSSCFISNDIVESFSDMPADKSANEIVIVEQFENLHHEIAKKNLELTCSLYDSNLNRKQVQFVVKEFEAYFTNIINNQLKHIVLKRLKDLNENKVNLKGFENVFGEIQNQFYNINTEHKRTKLLNENNLLTLNATQIEIGSYMESRKKNDGIYLDTVKVHESYVAIKKSMKTFLENGNTFEIIMKYKEFLRTKTENYISSCTETEFWKEKLLNLPKNDGVVIEIRLYSDDFENNNGLGSCAGLQKLAGVYYSIVDFPVEFNSKIENIFLILLYNALDRKKYGNRRILKPLIDELNELFHDGFVINTDSNNYKIYVMITHVIGDNLGIHVLLGFSEGFNANFFVVFAG